MLQKRKGGHGSGIPKIKNLTLSLLLLTSPAQAELVQSCNDGDTCRVKFHGKTFKVRLSGIDAPESDQEHGKDARDFLSKLVSGKDVMLKCDGTSYDRRTCRMYLGKIDVQEEMVKSGWALDAPKYSNGKYRSVQQAAQKEKRGIWKSDFTSPHCFRWIGTKECNLDKKFQP